VTYNLQVRRIATKGPTGKVYVWEWWILCDGKEVIGGHCPTKQTALQAATLALKSIRTE